MDKRTLSKSISYLLLVILLIGSWKYYQVQLSETSNQKQELQKTFSTQEQSINKLKIQLEDLQNEMDTSRYKMKGDCGVSSCTFSKKSDKEDNTTINSGFIMIKGHLNTEVEISDSGQNYKAITLTTPTNSIPPEIILSDTLLEVNTFYLSDLEKTIIDNSNISNNISIGIVLINKQNYAVFTKTL